jgi:hypothetical protein
LDYPAGEPRDVLMVSCEDDPEDTIVPRLIAARPDLRRVHFLKGVKTGKGRPAPFSLLHLPELEQTLTENLAIKLVIIDPAGAYVGATVMDDHKDSQLRALLGPPAPRPEGRSRSRPARDRRPLTRKGNGRRASCGGCWS